MLSGEVKMCSHEIESTINSWREHFSPYSLFDETFCRTMPVKAFSDSDVNAPLDSYLTARFPSELAAFVKTTAAVDGVSESKVVRSAIFSWAKSQGFSGC